MSKDEPIKICSMCGKEKTLNEFYYARGKPICECKICTRARSADYYTENREEINQRRRLAYIDKHSVLTDWRLQRTFGITLEEYDTMLEAQGGGCAICGKTPEENGKRLAVDHNHTSDIVRGLLCTSCNFLLGCAQDSPEICRVAMLYLRSYE